VETTITLLPPSEREVYRKLTAERVSILQENNKFPHAQNTQSEAKIIQSIKTKLNDSRAMITWADKGNLLVILPTAHYENKTEHFIQSNNFLPSKTNPTESFQTQVRKVINNSKTLIPSDTKWKNTNLNPSAPSIKGLIKLHKPEHPIRPLVNWRGAPTYKLARLFTQKIRSIAPLPNTYTIGNTKELIKKLESTPILPQYSLASLDISSLYTNVPVKETKDIIANTLVKNKVDPQIRQELLNWYDTITHQNYFSSNGKILIQQDGLATGAPSSGLIAEFFLQNLEDTHLTQLFGKHSINAYFCYVDDILIIYDSRHTDNKNIQDDFNVLHPIMKFTAEPESDKQINFLDITICKTPTKWITSIYRKPSFTDSIIPYSSNHPPQHKHAAVRYLYNRLNTYHLQNDEYKEELDTIHDIMLNNGFLVHTYIAPSPGQPTMTPNQKTDKTTQKWAPFTYVGRETTFITNLFKKTDLRITLHQQHPPETTYAKTPNPGQIQQIRSIQTNMPGLQQGVCREDGEKLHTKV
jgi:hypothetical protein